MEEFTLKGDGNYLKIELVKVYGFPKDICHWGGYDTESILEIEVGDFKVNATIYVSTGEIFKFYNQLLMANKLLTGKVHFTNYEENLSFDIIYDVNDIVNIEGGFSSQIAFGSELKFEFSSDQSYVQSTLTQLKVITDKYGGMKGVK